MRRLVVLVALLPAFAAAQGTLVGRVADAWGGLPGVHVVFGGPTDGAATDLDGDYAISKVPAGTYTVTASFPGYETKTRAGVVIGDGEVVRLDFLLPERDLGDLVSCGFTYPIISSDPFASRWLLGPDYRSSACGASITTADLPTER